MELGSTKMKSNATNPTSELENVIDDLTHLKIQNNLEETLTPEEKSTSSFSDISRRKELEESDDNNEDYDDENEEHESDEEDMYLKRGPWKTSRSNHNNSRFNPMNSEQHMKVSPVNNITNTSAVLPSNWDSFSVPLTPPYFHSPNRQEELFYSEPKAQAPQHKDAQNKDSVHTSYGPSFYNGEDFQLQNGTPVYNQYQYESSPNYNSTECSPVYHNGSECSPTYNLSPEYNNYNQNYYCSSAADNSPLSFNSEGDDLDALEAVTKQLKGGLLTSNYLDAFEDAVAKTVADKTTAQSSFSSSEDEDNSSCSSNSSVQYIVDSLQGIDPNEFDYIAPSTPGRHDLEEELALSAELSEQSLVTPPLSPLSPNMGSPYIPQDDSGNSPNISSKGSKGSKGVLGKRAMSSIKKLCNDDIVLKAIKRVACQGSEELCSKDADGDTCFMIVVCKPADSNNFYENLFVLQQYLMKINICCGKIVHPKLTACCSCAAKPSLWSTPLSIKNNVGDSVITCAAKMQHPEKVVNYLLTGIANNSADIAAVFDSESKMFLNQFTDKYPALKKFIC